MKVHLEFTSNDFSDAGCSEDELSFFEEFIVEDVEGFYTVYSIDTDHDKFSKLIKLSDQTEAGLNFIPRTIFSSDEIDHADYYEVIGEKSLRESETEFNTNLKHELQTRLIESGAGYKIRVIDKRFKKNIKLRDDTIGCISDGRIAEYVISEKARTAFEQLGLKGAKYVPLYHTNGVDRHLGYYQIFTETIMPPAEIDLSFRITESPLSGAVHFNKFGAFSCDYKLIQPNIDFFRSAEPIYCESTTAMIVSQKVLDCYKLSKMKGLKFYPVLDTNSDVYIEYIKKWKRIYEVVFSNRKNSILEYALNS